MHFYNTKVNSEKKGVYYNPIKKFKGEIIVERRINIDLSLEMGHVSQEILKNIPKNENYDERIKHYNLKTKIAFENQGFAS